MSFYRTDIVPVLGRQTMWVCGETSGVADVSRKWTHDTPATVEESVMVTVPLSSFAAGCVFGTEEKWRTSRADVETRLAALAADLPSADRSSCAVP